MAPPVVLFARGLALLWAGFWMFFFVAESVAWHTPVGLMLPWVGVGLLFVLAALTPWRWETGGGILLTTVGLLAGVAHAIWWPGRVLTTVVFGVPPIAAGVLFVIHDRTRPATA